MRNTSLAEEEEQEAFALKAALYFAAHPTMATYGDVRKSSFLAVRWGMNNDGVVVLKLCPDHEPTNYRRLIALQEST